MNRTNGGPPNTEIESWSPDKIKQRRQLVRKILASGGLLAGAQALPITWTKPVVESVVLPAHAQTSVLVRLGGQTLLNEIADSAPSPHNILDFFLNPAHAINGATLDGGCIIINIVGQLVDVVLTLNDGTNDSGGPVALNGTSFTISGLHGSAIVNGSVNNQSPPTGATGTITNGAASYSFNADESGAMSCTPFDPTAPTTAAPTTTLAGGPRGTTIAPPTTTTSDPGSTTTTSVPGSTTTTTTPAPR